MQSKIDLKQFQFFLHSCLVTGEQENHLKRWKVPKWLLSITGRTCNPTPFVHKDMMKKTT